jgi:hypothetical protein
MRSLNARFLVIYGQGIDLDNHIKFSRPEQTENKKPLAFRSGPCYAASVEGATPRQGPSRPTRLLRVECDDQKSCLKLEMQCAPRRTGEVGT